MTNDTHRPWAQEQLLIDRLAEMSGERILCTSLGVAQFARAAARQWPQARVACLYLDLYRAGLAIEAQSDRPENLSIECAADFPPEEVDLVVLPLSARGEGELARDLMQAGHQRLRLGGQLWVSTDNPADSWLLEQMQKLFDRVVRRAETQGVVYMGRKTEPLRKVKDFNATVVFRDRGRLIRAVSRPGVFSHRRLDAGARQVLNRMEIEPGQRVLDIGCGSGAIALAAAVRAPDVQVHAVDSCVRAVECVGRGAELNGLSNVTAELNAAGHYRGSGTYQLALANPPYYAAFQIAEHFLRSGREAIEPGGTIIAVTKSPAWYEENMPRWFANVRVEASKEYFLATGIRP
jgi:16S rRNA (guanine1207-N2)-methyltransferase